MSRLRSTASGGLGLDIAQTDVIPHAGLRGYFRVPGDLWIHFCDRESLCYVPAAGDFCIIRCLGMHLCGWGARSIRSG